MSGVSTSEQGKGVLTLVPGYNADLNSLATVAGQPVFHLPFETTPHDHKFCGGSPDWGLRFFGVTRLPVAYQGDSGAILRTGKMEARVKAAATALPGAYLIPIGGDTLGTEAHFAVAASPTPYRLVTNLSGQTSGTIYGPDNPASISSVETVPEIIIDKYEPNLIIWPSPAAASTTAIHAAVTDTGVEVEVTTGITDPDCPRALSATAGGTAGDIKAIQVVVAGTNILGEAISETLPVFTVDTAGTVSGALAFATVTSITIPAHDGTGATTAVGTLKILGLPDAAAVRLVESAILNGTVEGTLPTLVKDADEIEKNTLSTNSSLAGTELAVRFYE